LVFFFFIVAPWHQVSKGVQIYHKNGDEWRRRPGSNEKKYHRIIAVVIENVKHNNTKKKRMRQYRMFIKSDKVKGKETEIKETARRGRR
jgi:hypothetical protein